jgi:hypothetical protein
MSTKHTADLLDALLDIARPLNAEAIFSRHPLNQQATTAPYDLTWCEGCRDIFVPRGEKCDECLEMDAKEPK